MKLLIKIFALCACLFYFPSVLMGDDDLIFSDFEARQYTREELRLIQLGLAFSGHYQGLLDGAWGKISQRSLSRYSSETFGITPLHVHAAVIALDAAEEVGTNSWQYSYSEMLGLSFLMPEGHLIEGEHSDNFFNLEHTQSTLRYSIGIGDVGFTQGIHDYAENFHKSSGSPYTVRKQGFAVTSSKNEVGKILYVRSRLWRGQWSTLLLSADATDSNYLGAVSSSISNNKNIKLRIPENGLLAVAANRVGEIIAEAESETDEFGTDGSHQNQTKSVATSTGSGFRVTNQGHILTNAHVVEHCSEIKVNGENASLVNASSNFDLALLKSAGEGSVAEFSDLPALLNQDITVVGYPLSYILGGVNVTRGAVSGMTGISGDETTLQISAPVQVGNSGGPVIALDGSVIGVVVSKLDREAVEGAFGDTPQNINFAVRGEIAKLFLTLNGIQPSLNKNNTNLSPVELASAATEFTVFIECD